MIEVKKNHNVFCFKKYNFQFIIANLSTQNRVAFWGMIEAVVVILVAIFQIWWLRR